MIPSKEVVRVAREQIGTKYRDRSAQKGIGVCCFGLIEVIAAELGVACPSMGAFSTPSISEVDRQADRWFAQLIEPQNGCIVLIAPGYRLTRGAPILHWGILTDQSRHKPWGLLHSARGNGKVWEERFSSSWQKRAIRYYSFRDSI